MQFCPTGEKATRASGLSHFHCANDHSDEKYLGSSPFKRPILDVVLATVPEAAEADASLPSSSEKMWIVPANALQDSQRGAAGNTLVSLLQQMRLPILLKLKQYKLADVLPRLSSRRGNAVAQSNIRTIVPFWLAVASLLPSCASARAANWVSWAATSAVFR
jgi:hypothetical protein